MKRALLFLAAVGLLAGLVSFPLIAQGETPQTASEKIVQFGAGVELSELNYLVGVGELTLDGYTLYGSFGFAGYPQGEYPHIGMTWAAPMNLIWFWDEVELFGQDFLWGPGVGLTLFWVSSPKLPPGVTVSFANFVLLPLQLKWEGQVDHYSLFIRGGPFITLGQGALGLSVEGGLWLWLF